MDLLTVESVSLLVWATQLQTVEKMELLYKSLLFVTGLRNGCAVLQDSACLSKVKDLGIEGHGYRLDSVLKDLLIRIFDW